MDFLTLYLGCKTPYKIKDVLIFFLALPSRVSDMQDDKHDHEEPVKIPAKPLISPVYEQGGKCTSEDPPKSPV